MSAKSIFEVANQNLRALLRYMRSVLGMSPEAIEYQITGILKSLLIEEINELDKGRGSKIDQPR